MQFLPYSVVNEISSVRSYLTAARSLIDDFLSFTVDCDGHGQTASSDGRHYRI